MNNDLSILRDPIYATSLRQQDNALIGDSGNYPIINGIPRFVSADNYANDFGLQWKQFPKTQLDSYTGSDLSASRLSRCIHSELSSLKGKVVLEAGSGAGRFTELLIRYGAVVHSFDYSAAVEANALNNGAGDQLTLVQADIRHIPFQDNFYDLVLCLGVLQHTPDPEESISSLWRMVKPGGNLAVDHYLFKWRNILPPPIGPAEMIYRWMLLSVPPNKRLSIVKRIVDYWFPIHWKYRDSLFIQRVLRRISPVHFYYPHYPLKTQELYYEWALLDTHDGTTDFHKHHRSVKSIQRTLLALGAQEISVNQGGNGVEAFCRKPTHNEQ